MKTIRNFRWRGSLALLALGAALGALAATCSQPKRTEPSSMVRDAVAVVGGAFSPTPAFAQATALHGVTLADIAEKAVPSVVNISATRLVKGQLNTHPFFTDPFFRDFFGPFDSQPRDRKQQSLGSGVIVAADGIILTSNHVVEHAEEIQVTLTDGRDFDAEIAGTDPKSDLAVIRLKGKVEKLVPLPFGPSSNLRLGDVVLAIGNPFGVGQTVTMGIVSATGRVARIVDYENFIQTDAAINPGNSGGALVNMRGELVGINTAILSRSGGYQGIGFAIPTDMAQPIMRSLLEHGTVRRGFLGVSIQQLDSDLAAGLGLSIDQGILVSDVSPDSPAAKAGLKRGDVIVGLNDKKITSRDEFRNRIAAAGPGAKAKLTIVREGKERTLTAVLASLDKGSAVAIPARGSESGALNGLRVVDLSRALRERYNIPSSVDRGVVVVDVTPLSPAQQIGLRPGDVILEMNRKPTDSVATFEKLNAQAKKPLVVLVSRQGSTVYLALRD